MISIEMRPLTPAGCPHFEYGRLSTVAGPFDRHMCLESDSTASSAGGECLVVPAQRCFAQSDTGRWPVFWSPQRKSVFHAVGMLLHCDASSAFRSGTRLLARNQERELVENTVFTDRLWERLQLLRALSMYVFGFTCLFDGV